MIVDIVNIVNIVKIVKTVGDNKKESMCEW